MPGRASARADCHRESAPLHSTKQPTLRLVLPCLKARSAAMIHSATAVETENFDTPPASPEPPAVPSRRRFPLPAEYYSAPPGDRRPLVAPWAPIGCGIVSIVMLAIAFTGGYLASHGGAMTLMNWFINRSRTDIPEMY